MTVDELNSLFYIDKEIQRIKQRIYELRNETGLGAASIESMPHGNATNSTVERIALKKVELLEYLEKLQEQKTEETIRIHKYIYSCEDVEIQSIMSMRFIDLRSWYIIGAELSMDRCTAQRKVRAYLKSH